MSLKFTKGYDQIYTYFDKSSVKHHCGFCKSYNAQHCFLAMTEKMKEVRDKNKVFATILTDLSKAFDCLKHDLIIAKLQAFGLDYWSLTAFYAYRNNTFLVTKLGSYHSEIHDIILAFLRAQY